MAGGEGPESPPLALGLGRSASSSDNCKVSSPAACIMSPSSVKETDEESPMDLGLNFDLSLGHGTADHNKKSAGSQHVPLSGAPELDLQLTLSTGAPESAVTNTGIASINVHDALETVMPNFDKDVVGKRSEPSYWIFGHSLASSPHASEETYSFSLPMTSKDADEPSPDVSSAVTASVKKLSACTSGVVNLNKRKEHGGGKRCSWDQKGSRFGLGGPPCDKFTRRKTGLCGAHSALIEDHCVRGGGSLGPAIKQLTTDAKPDDEMRATSTKGDADMSNGDGEGFLGWCDPGLNSSVALSTAPFPEGRVHGRGLLASLSAGAHDTAGSSENGASTSAPRTWM